MEYPKALTGLVLAAVAGYSLPASAKADPPMLAVAPVGSVLGVAPAGGSPAMALPSRARQRLGPALPYAEDRGTPRLALWEAARHADHGTAAPPPTTDDGRNLDRELRRLYRQIQPALRSCFLRAARRGLEPEAKLELTLAVSPEGAVHQVSFAAPATPALNECVQQWVGRFRFTPGERAELPLSVLFRGGAR